MVVLFCDLVMMMVPCAFAGVRALVRGSSFGVPCMRVRENQLGVAPDHDDQRSLR